MNDGLHFVYIMTDVRNSVLYVGMTSNLARRIASHKDRLVSGFTQKYSCTKCVYFESAPDRNAALYREKQIKGWTRVKKAYLVNGFNPEWKDLFDVIITRQSS